MGHPAESRCHGGKGDPSAIPIGWLSAPIQNIGVQTAQMTRVSGEGCPLRGRASPLRKVEAHRLRAGATEAGGLVMAEGDYGVDAGGSTGWM